MYVTQAPVPAFLLMFWYYDLSKNFTHEARRLRFSRAWKDIHAGPVRYQRAKKKRYGIVYHNTNSSNVRARGGFETRCCTHLQL